MAEQTESGRPSSEEIQERMRQGATALQQLLRMPGGEEAINYLKAIFDAGSPFVKGDAYETHLRLGEQNVVRYLEVVRNSEITYASE